MLVAAVAIGGRGRARARFAGLCDVAGGGRGGDFFARPNSQPHEADLCRHLLRHRRRCSRPSASAFLTISRSTGVLLREAGRVGMLCHRRGVPDDRACCRSSRSCSACSPTSACLRSAIRPIRCCRNWSAARRALTTIRSMSPRSPKRPPRAIGARGLLVRVGAYFHDIGKMLKPDYFVENPGFDANRHETLRAGDEHADHHRPHQRRRRPRAGSITCRSRSSTSSSSTTARRWSSTFITGRTSRAKPNPDAAEVDESSYRYPGPKPQTKEAAVLMMADAVESASRALVDPTPARIEGLVHEIAMKRLLDDQFDECGLTLQELADHRRQLGEIAHGRLSWPREVSGSTERMSVGHAVRAIW